MNTKTLITIKTDKSLKEAAQEAAREIGIPLGTLLNTFLRQFVRTKEVTLTAALRPTAKLQAIIEKAERDLAAGENISPKFRTAKEAIRYLRS